LKSNQSDDADIDEIVIVNLLGFIPSVFIVLINLLLTIVIQYFSKMEKHENITDFNTSRAYKLTTAMFINTALIAPIVYQNNLYGADGLIAEVYNIIIANAIISPLLQFVAPQYLEMIMRRQLALKQAEKCKLT
jgi:hypothetical protein